MSVDQPNTELIPKHFQWLAIFIAEMLSINYFLIIRRS